MISQALQSISQAVQVWILFSSDLRILSFKLFKENETGVEPPVEEVFTHCHIKRDKTWVDNRAEQAYGNSKKRKA